jgi:hypothetical protein
MPMSRSPTRIAALTKVAAIQHDVVWEDAGPGGSASTAPMGVTVFGGGDRAAVLSAEVDQAQCERRGKIHRFLPVSPITKTQHFATTSLPRATHA